MPAGDLQVLGGETVVEGVLRYRGGCCWIRQGIGRVLVFAGFDVRPLIGQRVSVPGMRATAAKRLLNRDAIWVTGEITVVTTR